MKIIYSEFLSISEVFNLLKKFLKDNYNILSDSLSSVNEYLNSIKNDTYCYFEYPYVDKVYRNSYYNYFSTKHSDYSRDCIRISFFSNIVKDDDFRTNKKIEYLIKNYLGFLVIRPTQLNLIGRSMLSPKVFLNSNFNCCLTKSISSINGIKLESDAFPHSSQDQETITCAETTIWSLMEYFGTKYSDYIPILPSKIIEVLKNFSFERQIPSMGLTAQQISFALKEFGFGTRLYSVEGYSQEELYQVTNSYIESGIPVIAAIENSEKNIAHAILIIGRELISNNNIDNANSEFPIPTKKGLHGIISFSSVVKDYVIIDDNMPPYQVSSLDYPGKYYNDGDFKNCKLTNIIVPLHSKIYLEALKAKQLCFFIVKSFEEELKGDRSILRLFITSSRSLKNKIAVDDTINANIKELIIQISMPKFVWICEFSSKDLLKKNKAYGMIVLDATEINYFSAYLFSCFPNNFKYVYNNQMVSYDIGYDSFNIFQNNLKGEWSEWHA